MLGRIWHYASNNPLVAGLLVLLVGSGSAWAWVAPARAWLSADARVMRGVLLLLMVLLLTAAFIIYKQVAEIRRLHARPPKLTVHAPIPVTNGPFVSVGVRPQSPQELFSSPARFNPDAFKPSPLRARALLALSNRVEQRTTVHELYEDVMTFAGRYVEEPRSNKGRLQQDLDEAAQAGIVRVESVAGGPSNYYALTEPGLKWVLSREDEFKALAPVDMIRYA